MPGCSVRPRPVLVVLAGLPGVGKTTVAAEVAHRLPASFLRVDAVESGLVAAGLVPELGAVGPGGYTVTAHLARACLAAGLPAVVDAVNPVAEARRAWRTLARELGVPLLTVEVVCSDAAEHRRRVTARRADLPGHQVPTWADVVGRHYEEWGSEAPLRVDTAGGTAGAVDEVVRQAARLAAAEPRP